MREVLPELLDWWEAGETAGVGTVVATYRSAPRQPGATMLVGPDGRAVGSVSGGCVEAAVYDLAQQISATGTPVLQRYGVSDDDAFAVGLTCGGIIDVYVEPVDRASYPELGEIAADIRDGRPVAVATLVTHPDQRLVGRRLVVRSAAGTGGRPTDSIDSLGSLGSRRLDEAAAEGAAGLLAVGQSRCLSFGADGQRQGEAARVFVRSFAPAPRMLVFGAIDFAAALAETGRFLGYRVTVCDARPVFATAIRFPGADEVVVSWPDRYLADEAAAGRIDGRAAICVLTHDPKFDVPLLQVALRLPEVAYVGAMGSRRTHARRMTLLREAGLTPAELARLSGPIGLDLGARTPEETALSIAAELVALSNGGSGARLTDRSGRIHGAD
ncbi:XdhC family protein [Streptomyces aureus]|uniref:XdhC family protein n=1 Tax=Streptomyces aureus TaxID=193461 RepID=A0ABV4SPI2_9ACTN